MSVVKQRESKELSVPPLLLLWEENPVLSLGYFPAAPVSYPKVSAVLSAGGLLDTTSLLHLVTFELCLGKLKPGEPVWPAAGPACDALHREDFGSVLSCS